MSSMCDLKVKKHVLSVKTDISFKHLSGAEKCAMAAALREDKECHFYLQIEIDPFPLCIPL